MTIKISELGNLSAISDNTLFPAVDTSGPFYTTVKATGLEFKNYVLNASYGNVLPNTAANVNATLGTAVSRWYGVYASNVASTYITANIGTFNYISGNLTTAAQTNITSLGTIASLTAGTVYASGIIQSATGFSGDGSRLTNINGANVTIQSGQFLIVGNLTYLNVAGNTSHYGNVNILTSNASISTTTGALTVAGGAGVSGNLYVGAGIFGPTITLLNSNVTQANLGMVGFVTSTGTAGNTYADSKSLASNSYALSQSIAGNAYALSQSNAANAYALSQAIAQSNAANAYMIVQTTAGNAYALSQSNAANAYALSQAIAQSNAANAYAASYTYGVTQVGTLANLNVRNSANLASVTGSTVGIGTNAGLAKLTVSQGASLQTTSLGTPAAHLSSDTTTQLFIDGFGSGAGASIIGRAAAGTSTSPTAVALNQTLLTISGRGYGATAFSSGRVAIQLVAAEAWSDTAQGTYMVLSTSAKTTATTLERVRIDDNGNVFVGVANPTNYGNLQIGHTTTSTSTTTGALQVAGGVGIAGALYTLSDNTSTVNAGAVNAVTVGNTGSTGQFNTINAGAVNAVTVGNVGATVNGSLLQVGNILVNVSGNIQIANSYASTSTTSGALTVAGGVGIGGAINAGGNLIAGAGNLILSTAGYLYNAPNYQQGIVQAQQYFALNSNLYVSSTGVGDSKLFGVNVFVAGSTTYEFETGFTLQRPSQATTSHIIQFNLGQGGFAPTYSNIAGIATVTNVQYQFVSTDVATTYSSHTAAQNYGFQTNIGNVAITAAVTAATYSNVFVQAFGLITVSTAGWLSPRVSFSAAAGGNYYTLAGSFFKLTPLGPSSANVSIGSWTQAS